MNRESGAAEGHCSATTRPPHIHAVAFRDGIHQDPELKLVVTEPGLETQRRATCGFVKQSDRNLPFSRVAASF